MVAMGTERLSGWLRATWTGTAVVPLLLLAIAGSLRPDASGIGTHRQLGLPPCSLRMLAGMRCPACGMTTAWSHFARGHWKQSWQTQPAGCLLAAYGMAWAAMAVSTGVRGFPPSVRTQQAFAAGILLIAATSLIHWGRIVFA